MRRNKEILVLIGLLLGMIAFILWYVADRRARNHGAPLPAMVQPATRALPAGVPAGTGTVVAPVDLKQHEGQTLDFSSGAPVVQDSAADRAAIAKAKQEMDEAVKGVTFGPTPRKTTPPPAPAPAPKN